MSDIQVKHLKVGMVFTPRISGLAPRNVIRVTDRRNSPYDEERDFEVVYETYGSFRSCVLKGADWLRIAEPSEAKTSD